jgi:hypothetical protein
VKRKDRVTKAGKIGRPTVKKDGQPMTDAERQARRRKRVGRTMNRQARARYQRKKQGNAAQLRREASRNAPPLPNGTDLRIGDCRKMLANIADNSVALVITDPPYERRADPLYSWLGLWAHRVLMPGGSLFCFVGQAWVYDRMTLLRAPFGEEFWMDCALHTSSQRFMGKNIYPGWKPVLWYVKGNSRRDRVFVSDVLRPNKDKTLHEWAQGDGGIQPLIENLSRPGELIGEPFCGPGTWGRIVANMGRRWVGCDVSPNGSKAVVRHHVASA